MSVAISPCLCKKLQKNMAAQDAEGIHSNNDIEQLSLYQRSQSSNTPGVETANMYHNNLIVHTDEPACILSWGWIGCPSLRVL